MRKIHLIAGHEGRGTGACGMFDEGHETIVLREAIKSHLTGVEVVTDVDKTSLGGVIAWLNKLVGKKELLVDIHFNASKNETANGTEVFIPDTYTETERTAATQLLNIICNTINTYRRGVKTEKQTALKSIGMLRKIDCHNVLIEVCFCTNKRDAEAYLGARNALAKNIASVLTKIVSEI